MEGAGTLAGILKFYLIISFLVMEQIACEGRRLSNSPDGLEKNLPGINQASVGHCQVTCRCPADGPVDVFFPGRAPADHLQGIYRASTEHLGVACRCLSKKCRLFFL